MDRGGLGCGQMPLRGVCWGGMGSWAEATDAWVLVVRRWGTLVESWIACFSLLWQHVRPAARWRRYPATPLGGTSHNADLCF